MSPTRNTYPGSLRIRAGNLDPVSFAPFGSVIQNPESHGGEPRLGRDVANQGSATKWLDVTEMSSHYHLGRSGRAARLAMNMFVCRPRSLRDGRLFDVKVLERHPFTAQSFVPVGLGKEDRSTYYLVIVAPTLPLSSGRKGKAGEEALQPPYPTPGPPQQKKRTLRERLMGARPNPFTNDYAPSTTPSESSSTPTASRPKGPGPPDLNNLIAFIARGDQAVTYGPGTWHAPMVVLGEKPIEFVVVQYANGVGVEDCQEVEIVAEGGEGISIDVVEDGEVKAKL